MIPTKRRNDNTKTVGPLLRVILTLLASLQFTILQFHVFYAVLPTTTVDATCVSATSSDSTPIIATDVIIVGAGAAGLSAYREIQRLEPTLNIILLEATDRIGGRVKKATFGGYTVELGANWLHNNGTAFR